MTLNKTRLDNSISDSEVKISGYNIVRRERNRNGGGKLVRKKRRKLYLVDSLKILMLTSFRKRYNINANIIRDDPNRR